MEPRAAEPVTSMAHAMPAAVTKLCLLGAPGVGKTTLAQRLTRDGFVPADTPRGIVVTITPDAGGRALAVWDVATSCALDSLNQAFLSRVDILLGVAAAHVPHSLRVRRPPR